MKKEKYYLDYVNEDGEIVKELKGAVRYINKTGFKINDFYRSLNNIIMNVCNQNLYDILHKLVSIKPEYSIGTIYYLMKEFDNKEKNKKELLELEKYRNERIDLFMIINFIRQM